ncbi:hypothetical protein ACFXI0_26800 [Kitasatospora indigofera]|uniref:hypothetical protein n=1 Tax=Kitasatospora indigofera TaxID=67307 RepID=UPI0036A29793
MTPTDLHKVTDTPAGTGCEAVESVGAALEVLESVVDEDLKTIEGHHGKVGEAVLDVSPDPFHGG